MNNDLISREALKDKAETVTLWNGEVRRFVSYETIDNAPTVELDESIIQEVLNKRCMTVVANEYLVALHGIGKEERPHGKWKFYNAYFKTCSLCNKTVGFDYIEQNGEKFNYCPNCGAKMDGGVEEWKK